MSLMNRRRMMGAKAEPKVPDEYQRCEYVMKGSGKTIIEAGKIDPTKPITIEIGVYLTGTSTYGALACCVGYSEGGTIRISINLKETVCLTVGKSPAILTGAPNPRNKYVEIIAEINTENGSSIIAKLPDKTYTATNEEATTSFLRNEFNVFADSTTVTMYGRNYYARVKQNGKMVFNLIPHYRKSDGVVGMYDLANMRFIEPTNGTLTKGPDVL